MPTFSFIVPCMGRLEHLQRSLPPRLGWPGCENVVVDYSCPDRVGDWVEEHARGARVVRVEGEELFNASAARNVGAALARSDWLVFVDADVIVGPALLEVLQVRAEPGVFLEAPTTSSAAGTLAVTRADFRRAGGFDDVYRGWGEEDLDFRERLVELGLKPVVLSDALFDAIEHSDELRTRFYACKDCSHSLALHRVYRSVKFDLMRLQDRPPSEEVRRDFWTKVDQLVATCLDSGEAEDLIVSLSDQVFGVPAPSESGELRLKDGWRLKRSLVYELEWSPDYELP